MTSETPAAFRTGYVAIVGRPNVGKSTLLNQLIGSRISITADKPQTTRHRILGNYSDEQSQFLFVDTPGYQTRHVNPLNRMLNQAVTSTLADIDAVVFMVEAGRFLPADRQVLKLLPAQRPVVLVVNKVDRLADKTRLLPFLAEHQGDYPWHAVVPISAERGYQVDRLREVIRPLLPEAPPLFDPEQLTDRNERFLVAERLREKIFRLSGDEIPYGTTVVIERYEEEGALRKIWACVLVDRDNHKAIIIGKGGEKLKAIASQARRELEELLDSRIHLEVFVKVRSGWADDPANLRALGYES